MLKFNSRHYALSTLQITLQINGHFKQQTPDFKQRFYPKIAHNNLFVRATSIHRTSLYNGQNYSITDPDNTIP